MTNTLGSISSTTSCPLCGPTKAVKAKLPHSGRSLTVIENDHPSLSRNSSIQELQREETQGFQPINSEEEASLLPTDEEQVKAFKFNEDELRETLNSLCNDDPHVLEFLQTEGKSKKQQVDEYKQLKKDINNGIKFHSEISGMPDIETLKLQKKLITQAAIAAGIEKPKLDIVKNFFSNKDNTMALGVTLAGLVGGLSTLIAGIITSKNTVDKGIEETEEMAENKKEIADSEQKIKEWDKKLDLEDKQKDMEEQIGSNAKYKVQKELEQDLKNFNSVVENGNIIDKKFKPEAQAKIQQAGDNAVTEYRDQQKNIQAKLNEEKSRLNTLQNKLETQIAAASHKLITPKNSDTIIGMGVATMAGSLIAGGAIKYHHLKRNSQGKPNLDLSEADKNRLKEKKQQIFEEQKKIKENLNEIITEEKRLRQEVKEQAELSQREEKSKNAQNMYSISKQEYQQASKSIPEDSGITEVPNSSKSKISDQPTPDKSTGKESDVTKN